jgi:hypothetical protein
MRDLILDLIVLVFVVALIVGMMKLGPMRTSRDPNVGGLQAIVLIALSMVLGFVELAFRCVGVWFKWRERREGIQTQRWKDVSKKVRGKAARAWQVRRKHNRLGRRRKLLPRQEAEQFIFGAF